MKTPKTCHCDEQRRSFIKTAGLLGLGAASATLLPAQRAEAVLFGNKEYKVSKTRLTMGTYVAMTAIHPSRDEAEHAFGLAFAEIDRLNKLLSRYDVDSPIYQLNNKGALNKAPQEILELVARSLYYHGQTNGAFDITVKPLIDLYKENFATGNKPSEAQIQAALKNVGTGHLRFAGGNISFNNSEMGITLDGIAKGYIVDRASEILTRNGISNHLINAGGDIRTNGSAAKGKPWTIAVQDPAKNKEYPDVITMMSGAIATSGNYEIFYDNEKMFHHIIDSRTGYSPELSASVTVQAPTVMDADALSTSVFVMQPTAGVNFINGQHGCECFVVEAGGTTHKSLGWKAA
ncbi:MAG: FAD:protein FMN transferase [Thermodesulfobacteriota bacterium]